MSVVRAFASSRELPCPLPSETYHLRHRPAGFRLRSRRRQSVRIFRSEPEFSPDALSRPVRAWPCFCPPRRRLGVDDGHCRWRTCSWTMTKLNGPALALDGQRSSSGWLFSWDLFFRLATAHQLSRASRNAVRRCPPEATDTPALGSTGRHPLRRATVQPICCLHRRPCIR
jgi:hypothetical protein